MMLVTQGLALYLIYEGFKSVLLNYLVVRLVVTIIVKLWMPDLVVWTGSNICYQLLQILYLFGSIQFEYPLINVYL